MIYATFPQRVKKCVLIDTHTDANDKANRTEIERSRVKGTEIFFVLFLLSNLFEIIFK